MHNNFGIIEKPIKRKSKHFIFITFTLLQRITMEYDILKLQKF